MPDEKIYMAVYQFISHEFILAKRYLPRFVHTIGESCSLQVNDDFYDVPDAERQYIAGAANKVLHFIKLRKGIVIYHNAERKDLCKGKAWNTFNHFHLIWKSSCEPRKDSSWYNVTKAYHKATGYKRGIPKVLHMKLPSPACNYHCKSPRQIIIRSDISVMKTLGDWCDQKYIEKPHVRKATSSVSYRDMENEPSFTNVSGGSLNLFNYLNWIWTSKSYRSEGQMKADWITKSNNPNNNFMRAVSHPQYNNKKSY